MPLPLHRLLRREDGATAIEYALVALFVSIAAVGVIGSIGSTVTGFFGQVATSL